ncbi:transcriptional repressor LexA [Sulfoacidibacillus thermotolerans]|uniref:LexA repressor n=1 Tax=Sulfoacidibacillus thermotolerans TaxID=1765684 RepID=A0A2U3DAS7_SULT2|nr:transcriptional repressor LexA [Sulfoacidibacillus thermotolerans]PWI58387.1 repressor LexA [Sulfoacidibacillus thermotolerans]
MRQSAREKQEEILNFIKQAVSSRGYPPSVREIGDAVGLTSTSTVHSHLAKLEQRGLIRRDPTKPRAIEILRETAPVPDAVMIPIVGKVTAGLPITAVQDVEDYIPAPLFLKDRDNIFALRVIGDSMIDAGIFDGDIVYVHRQSSAHNGDIVVALTEEDEATIKRFFKEDQHIRLQPENKTMAPLIYRNVTIAGKVVGLWRTMP